MAPLLQIENITKSYGDRLLFADVTFGVNEGDKIGLIARNGMGKSTLLKIIAGKEDRDSGNVTFRADVKVAILEQSPYFEPECTPRELVDNFSEEPETRDLLTRLISQVGAGDSMDSKFRTLSGGQRKRVALAMAIAKQPDLLILDEPTNHLDIKTIEWLEGFLSRSRLALLMVTHDRYFLDRVCNRIIEIDREQIYSYPGNYKKYLEQRAHRIEVMSAELAKVKNTLRREQDWMSRQPQARAGKARYRINQFYELKEKSRIDLREKNVELKGTSTYIGNKIFSAENVTKSFGDKCVLKDFSYIFARHEKVGIVGENGVGKSTFVKMLQGLVKPDTGHFDIGETVSFGYYSQERAVFPPEKKVIDAVSDIAEDIDLGGQRLSPMQYLNHFLFSAKDQQKYISTLSGGELSRLYLATVLMRRPNFLILDEPTNDLDIVTLGILEEYLANYKGCAIIISHDRYFLDNIVDHLFVMEGGGIVRDFPGGYTDYREKAKEESKDAQAASQSTSQQAKNEKPKTERAARLTFKEKKEFEELSKEIENLTNEKKELENIFNSGQEVSDISLKAERYQEIKDLLDEKELRWLELSEKAE